MSSNWYDVFKFKCCNFGVQPEHSGFQAPTSYPPVEPEQLHGQLFPCSSTTRERTVFNRRYTRIRAHVLEFENVYRQASGGVRVRPSAGALFTPSRKSRLGEFGRLSAPSTDSRKPRNVTGHSWTTEQTIVNSNETRSQQYTGTFWQSGGGRDRTNFHPIRSGSGLPSKDRPIAAKRLGGVLFSSAWLAREKRKPCRLCRGGFDFTHCWPYQNWRKLLETRETSLSGDNFHLPYDEWAGQFPCHSGFSIAFRAGCFDRYIGPFSRSLNRQSCGAYDPSAAWGSRVKPLTPEDNGWCRRGPISSRCRYTMHRVVKNELTLNRTIQRLLETSEVLGRKGLFESTLNSCS